MPVPSLGDEKVRFVRAAGDELLEMESRYQVKKSDVVDALIERTCWGDSHPLLKPLRGHLGSDSQRLTTVSMALAEKETAAGEPVPKMASQIGTLRGWPGSNYD